jgi:hypothetical protein
MSVVLSLARAGPCASSRSGRDGERCVHRPLICAIFISSSLHPSPTPKTAPRRHCSASTSAALSLLRTTLRPNYNELWRSRWRAEHPEAVAVRHQSLPCCTPPEECADFSSAAQSAAHSPSITTVSPPRRRRPTLPLPRSVSSQRCPAADSIPGECKHIMASYLRCIKSHRGLNDPECRNLSKSYLSCRMDRYVARLSSAAHLYPVSAARRLHQARDTIIL